MHPHDKRTRAPAMEIQIRPLESPDDLRACVEMQGEIWGAEYDEIVPGSLMRAAEHVGALAIGAFSPSNKLVGFVFGFTGIHGGEVVHWSYMLGVRPAVRDHGVGRRLKEHQRSELARRGIKRMYWTFDPLQARNAHLNINRLGVRVVEYVVDMYGASRSTLHYGMATDRLLVEWPTTASEHGGNGEVKLGPDTPVFSAFPRANDVVVAGAPRTAGIEIPWDLQDVVAGSLTVAQEWRESTRRHFQWALANRYAVTGLHRDAAASRAFFVIDRSEV
jgi:predicted GNAT superfamily acetyltransferase